MPLNNHTKCFKLSKPNENKLRMNLFFKDQLLVRGYLVHKNASLVTKNNNLVHKNVNLLSDLPQPSELHKPEKWDNFRDKTEDKREIMSRLNRNKFFSLTSARLALEWLPWVPCFLQSTHFSLPWSDFYLRWWSSARIQPFMPTRWTLKALITICLNLGCCAC